MEFFKAVWDVIKAELMAVMKEFEQTGNIDWRLNCTNIIFIPKCEGSTSMTNFRPISLIGGVYQIISKLLADRLKLVIPCIISEFQGAFVDNRQITYEILIASELINSRERRQTGFDFEGGLRKKPLIVLVGVVLITMLVFIVIFFQ
ncbi:uncharacterized protein LOC113351936 [Papaver somniferum]|uniref:uncharacterized protein LOC113351936 n=1 Tax=Papaver somniferum TaxID=3469 RepID=UPI000E6FCE56|nr:uncharacterized protein LOC113351936 [Papaver somniferum]